MAVTMAVALVAIFGVAALAVDLGRLYVVEAELQTAADAAAMAALQDLGDLDDARNAAVTWAEANHDGEGPILTIDDVTFGYWDQEVGAFVAEGEGDPDNPVTAVRVTTRRSTGGGNPVSNFFAPVLGIDTTNVVAQGVAALSFTTVDFEGLPPGSLPLDLSHGAGINGEYVPGTIGIESESDHQNSRDCPTVEGVRTCQRIFDATCTGGCTGGDPDLRFPEQGNILIIQEHRCGNGAPGNGYWPEDWDYDGTNWPDNCDPKAPDDEAKGGTLTFDFTAFADGTVTVASLKLLDVEPHEIAHVTLWDASGNVLSEQQSGGPGDGNSMTWWLDPVSNVARMEIELQGSGAIDDLGYLRDAVLVG
ncbi:MAG: TadG family pilus assembly protein [Acidimicrobiales bacterium]